MAEQLNHLNPEYVLTKPLNWGFVSKLTIFKNATGLRINTHNFDKLIRYYSMVSDKIPAVFPRNNDANERHF